MSLGGGRGELVEEAEEDLVPGEWSLDGGYKAGATLGIIAYYLE